VRIIVETKIRSKFVCSPMRSHNFAVNAEKCQGGQLAIRDVRLFY